MRRQHFATVGRAGAALLLGLSWASGGAAQSVDYDALEQLFGEPITLSVTGSPLRASAAPAAMEIIDADEIRRSGAHDLPALLRHVAGVDVLQTTRDHADLSVRGYNQAFSPRLLVLVDGRQVYADYYGFTPWSTIPVELAAIRQIEVVRGPNSALYGFNAVGGVINIVTYDPRDEIVDAASASAGSQSFTQLSVVTGWRFGDRAGLRLSAGKMEADDFSTPQPAVDFGSRRGDSRYELNLLGTVRFAEHIEGRFEATGSSVDHTEVGPVYDSGFTTYDTSSAKASVSAETRLGLLEGTIYHNDMRPRIYQPAGTTPFIDLDNDVMVTRVESLTKIASQHTLRLSLEHRHNTLGTSPLEGGEVEYDVGAAAAAWTWQAGERVSLTLAGRRDRLDLARTGALWPGYGLTNADWNRVSHSVTSANAGVVWHPDDADTLRVMFGRGTQLPSLFDLGGLVIPEPPFGYVSGVPTLEPTVVRNSEVAFDRTLERLGAKLRVSVFEGTTRNIVASVGGADFANGIIGAPVNIGDSRVRGVEVALASNRGGGWRWGVSYTPLSIDDRFDPGFTVATTLVDFEHTAPRSVVNGNVGWARGPWEVDGYLRYESDFDGISATVTAPVTGMLTPIDAYYSLDARLGYRLNDRIDVSLSGQGLNAAHQRQTSAPDVERRIFGSVAFKF